MKSYTAHINILLKNSFAPLSIYSLYLKLAESAHVTLPNVKKTVSNNAEIMYGYVENIYIIKVIFHFRGTGF